MLDSYYLYLSKLIPLILAVVLIFRFSNVWAANHTKWSLEKSEYFKCVDVFLWIYERFLKRISKTCSKHLSTNIFPVVIYIFKINNKNAKTILILPKMIYRKSAKQSFLLHSGQLIKFQLFNSQFSILNFDQGLFD